MQLGQVALLAVLHAACIHVEICQSPNLAKIPLDTKAIAFVSPKLKIEFAPRADAVESTEFTDTKMRCIARSLEEQRPFQSPVSKWAELQSTSQILEKNLQRCFLAI